MKIPQGLIERQLLYSEVAEACLASRADRVTEYAQREAFYLFGSEPGNPPAEFNRVYSSLKNLKAFIYAADSTNFTLDLGVQVPKVETSRVPPVSRYINQSWKGSNSDAVASQCVEWALVYNSMIMKSLWVDGNFRTYAVRPHDFGVYNEAQTSIDDQEAMCHCWNMSLTEFKRRYAFLRNFEKILQRVQPSRANPGEQPEGLSRIILTASAPITPTNPNAVGSLSNQALSAQPNYNASNNIEMIEMRELWIWNDDKEDYQVVTMTGNEPLIDRLSSEMMHGKTLFPKEQNPFTLFTPSPKFNYIWGMSDVELVIKLQQSLNKEFADFDNLLEKNVRPPTSGYGYQEEQLLALMSVGGYSASTDPNASVQQHIPEIPEQLLRRIDMIYDGFADALALHNVLQGKGEPGVRGRGHAQELARISSARIKEKALSVEDSLEKAATLQLRIMADYDDTLLPDDNKTTFVLAQLTKDCTVKVDAHSNSPLFADDTREQANELFDKEIIDGKSYIDMTKPPSPEVLKQRYEELQKKKQQEEMMAAAQHGGGSPPQ